MPSSCCIAKTFLVTQLILSLAVAEAAQSLLQTEKAIGKEDANEQQAADQLRAIADDIKKCPRSERPEDYGTNIMYPPLNTVWDIENRQSASAGKIGSVEFVLQSSYTPRDLELCKKRESACERRNSVATGVNLTMIGVQPLDQFRYEFDLGTHGLEFVRALGKHQADDEHRWVATGLFGCEGDAVLMTLGSPPPDIPEALWDGAKAGDSSAMFRLGVLYGSGKGVPENQENSLNWYRRAADTGSVEAQFSLGVMYLEGKGVPRDPPKGMFWLRKAAEQSDTTAEFGLGYAYYYGDDAAAKDTIEAYFWFSLAAIESSPLESVESARRFRDEIAGKLKPAQLREVQQRVDQWSAAHLKNPK